MAQLQFLKSAVPSQRKAVEVAKDTSDGEAGDASAPGASKKERTKVGAVDRVKTPADLHFGCSACDILPTSQDPPQLWKRIQVGCWAHGATSVRQLAALAHGGAAVSCPAGAVIAARRVAANVGRQGDEGLALAQVAGAAQARGRPGEHSSFR